MHFPYFIFAFSEGGLVVQTKRTDTWLFLKKKIQTNTCKIAGDGNAEMREHKDAMTPGCGNAGLRGCQYDEMQGWQDAGAPGCRGETEMQKCDDTGMPRCRDDGARGWRSTGMAGRGVAEMGEIWQDADTPRWQDAKRPSSPQRAIRQVTASCSAGRWNAGMPGAWILDAGIERLLIL